VRRAVALVAGVVLLVVLGGCATPTRTATARTSTTLAGPPPPLPQAVIDTVLDVAARSGDATTPLHARYAYGTRRQALRALGMGDVPPNQVDSDVFVVVADGRFAIPGAKVRKGAPEPKGSYLVAVIDPDEPADALDVAVAASAPPLTTVGQVTQTDLGSPAPPS
jgi:hypothetical protein